jgi:hypothetical protein
MLRKLILGGVGFASLLASAKGAIDLTPMPYDYVGEGIKYRQLLFNDGDRRISYNLPYGWEYRFVAGQLQLKPQEMATTTATIIATPLPTPVALDDNAVAAFKQQLLSTLPPGSTAVAVVSEEQNPVLLAGAPSYEVTVSYQLFSEKLVRSAILVNLPDTQLVFKLAARKPDFEAMHQTFRTSILSWQWSAPKQAQGSGATTAAAGQSQ